LIATPNVDNANRRQEKGKKPNYKAMGGFRKREWQEWLSFLPVFMS
jgi:hypothetical protein